MFKKEDYEHLAYNILYYCDNSIILSEQYGGEAIIFNIKDISVRKCFHISFGLIYVQLGLNSRRYIVSLKNQYNNS